MSGKYFYIESQMHGKVVDVENGGTQSGARCIVWPKKPVEKADNQLFFECPLTGTIKTKANPELCLDVDDDDSSVHVTEVKYGDRDQAWDRANDMMVNRLTGKAIDICGADDADGAKILAWDIHGNVNQKWNFVYLPARYFRIVSRLNDKVLDVKGNDTNPGAQVIMWPRKDPPADNQLFYEDNNGFIRSKLSDLALDTEGKDLHLDVPEAGKESQRFCWDCGTGCIACVDCRDDVLDIRAENEDDGAEVQRYHNKDKDHQKWELEYVDVPVAGGGGGGVGAGEMSW